MVEATTETQAAFARRLGVHKSYVTKLKRQGRLAMSGDKVDVLASLKLIDNTAGSAPANTANAERLAAERALSAQPGRADSDVLADLAEKRRHADTRKAEAEAAMSEIKRAKMEGELCSVALVERAARRHGDLVRKHFEGLRDRYAAELAAESDPGAVRAILHEAAELALTDLAAELQQLGRSLVDED